MDGKINVMRRGLRQNGGFVKAIVTLVVALIVLKFTFDINPLMFFKSGWFQATLDKTTSFWSEYILPYLGTVTEWAKVAGAKLMELARWLAAEGKELVLKFYPEFLRPWGRN